MKIKSGVLQINKSEKKAFALLIEHVRSDMSYGDGGSFVKWKPEQHFDEKEAERVRRAIAMLEWIINEF